MISHDNIIDFLSHVHEDSSTYITSSSRPITVHPPEKDVSLALATLFVDGADIQYDTLTESIDSDLLRTLHDVKIKKKKIKIAAMDDSLQEAGLDLQQSIADWKVLLKKYLIRKYGEESDKYESLLKDIEII